MKLMAINDQMEMAFSGPAPRVDPVSGNDVPPGSLPEEVRDDIDVKLSEGEYVVPADVLRFHGVKFFEDLRAEAKMGLAGMDAAGRIGGEPVEGAPMDPAAMGISEEDVAMLEQALAGEGIPEAAMAEGGLMDKVAFAAMNDPLVNERINSKGMAVGFAAGGMTQSLYNDPTKIDSLIDQVMTAAQTNPSLLEQLSKRGVSINTTQADMQPAEMKQANTQPVELAEGGPVFNPMDYGLGFSSFGPMSPGGGTQVFRDKNGVVHATKALMDAANAVIDALAASASGVGLGSPPVDPNAGKSSNAPGGDKDQDRALAELGKADSKAWRSDFDYKNPNELYAQTMEKLTGDVGFIGKIFGATAIGRLANAGNLANLQSNIDYLKQRGGTADQIAGLQKAHDDLTIKQLGSLEGGIITGWAQNQLSTESLLEDNSESDMVGGGSGSSSTAGQEAAAIAASTPSAVTATVGTGSSGSGNNTNPNYDGSQNVNAAGTVVTTAGGNQIVTPTTGNTGGASAGGGGGGYDYVPTSSPVSSTSGNTKMPGTFRKKEGGGYSGGFQKGGLMIKKK